MTLAYAEAVYRTVARDHALSATECAVLAMVALMADENGSCWPKQQTIADRTRLHLDTVKTTLRHLHAKGLIGKVKRERDDGSQASNMILMQFPPADLTPGKSGDTPPRRGPTTPPPPGAQDPPSPGVDDPPLESSLESSGRTPPKPPKGGVTPEAKTLAKELWEEAPKPARQRSGLGDLERACNAALEARDANPEDIKRSLRACWSDLAERDATEHAKGVHRMVQQDRWREWMPDEGAEAPASAPRSPAHPPVPPEVAAAHMARIWRTKIEDFKALKWRRHEWGPPPGTFGCRVPPEFLAEANLPPTPEAP